MNVKTLRSLAAALVVTSLTQPAIAESLGEHPAVLVAQTWSSRGVDPNTLGIIPNTFIVLHPAGPIWAAATAKANNAVRDPLPRAVGRASASSK
ncbi:MAG: hypothetical protein WD795_15965 [Woeseia sp.]